MCRVWWVKMPVTATSTMVMKCCTTMKMRPSVVLVRTLKVPRTTSMGCTADITCAGTMPATAPSNTTVPTMKSMLSGLSSCMALMWVSSSWLV